MLVLKISKKQQQKQLQKDRKKQQSRAMVGSSKTLVGDYSSSEYKCKNNGTIQ